MRQRSLWRLALAGVFTGLLVYTYLAARFTPLLLLALGAEFSLARFAASCRSAPLSAVGRHSTWRSPGWSRCRWSWTLPFIPSTSARAPAGCSSLTPWLTRAIRCSALISNLRSHIGVWGFAGDPNWRHNYDSRPLLNLPEALVLLGRAAGGVDPLASARVPAAADLARRSFCSRRCWPTRRRPTPCV